MHLPLSVSWRRGLRGRRREKREGGGSTEASRTSTGEEGGGSQGGQGSSGDWDSFRTLPSESPGLSLSLISWRCLD